MPRFLLLDKVGLAFAITGRDRMQHKRQITVHLDRALQAAECPPIDLERVHPTFRPDELRSQEAVPADVRPDVHEDIARAERVADRFEDGRIELASHIDAAADARPEVDVE